MKTQGSNTDVVFLSGVRTGFGTFGGTLKDLSAIELGAVASKHALERSSVPPAEVGHCIFGNALQTSADAIYCARHIGLKAGLPIEVPAVTVNRLCGSGFEAITQGAQLILLGEAQAVLAGGTESMSQAPHVVRGARWGLRLGPSAPLEDLLWEALKDPQCGLSMAETAEGLADKSKLHRPEAARPPRRVGGGRGRAQIHGNRPGARGAQGAPEGRDEARADGSGGSERGVRAAVSRSREGARPRPRQDQCARRRDCHRPPARRHRDPRDDSFAPRLAPLEAAVRTWLRLHRGRPRRGGDRGGLSGLRRSAMDAVVTAVLGILALYLFGGLNRMREYERAVYFFLGRSWGAKGPGLIYVPPLFAKTQQVSLRVVALDIPPQDVITRDNISIKVNAVLYMLVRDPVKAVIGVENYIYATSQLAQTTLRSVLGETEMDELLMSREKINAILKNIIDKRTEEWGVEVSAVEVKDVDLPPEMKRAMARQAEAERERRAKIINAEGELQASEKLAQAAHIIGAEPAAIQLRYLQTVTEISSENNSTTFFPIPIDLFKGFLEAVARKPATPALPERTSGDTVPVEPKKIKAKA